MARTTNEKLEEKKGTRAAMAKKESSTQFQMAESKTQQTQQTLDEALVFTMLCIVGLPVEVQVKDGSVYSGIFHSANFSHGVVLKKAKKIAEGKHGGNVPLGSFQDTLVILSQDFVQLLVKDFALMPEGDMNNTNVKEGTLTKSIANSNQVENKSIISKEMVCMSDVKVPSCNNASSINGNGQSKVTAKESKLNPSARAFSPSIAKPRPVATVVPPIVNPYNAPNIKSVGTPPPNVAYNIVPPHPFVSDKPLLYNNIYPVNGGAAPAYSQPVLGCQATNVYPVGVASQYRPVQIAPTYMNPNAPSVMAARTGPTMCMHPIPQVGIQGAPIPQAWPRTMFNPYPSNVPRFQGVPPVCMTPPPITNVSPPIVIPGPMPIAPTLRPVQSIMVPTNAGTFPMKF
ncbi:hypothetical protein LUZ61_002308 [Rhynchospora tenuis]|uniref:Ataxin 2 SM domain-containing protein n=1 Tax=Rhynchospora tenuis TaxID=198213 RepID=A0AAD5ZIU1_9POAL|nr:hypothetical protein LUZ61_002308 [Rhynchospora tenuis]